MARLVNQWGQGRVLRHSTNPPKRVVVVEPYGMGDAISLLPLVESLLSGGQEVVVCARKVWRELLPPEIIWVEAEVPWASYEDGKKYKLSSLSGREMQRCLHSLREVSRGALGIDPRGDIRSVLLLWLAGCGRVLSLSHYLGCDLKVPHWAAELLPYSEADRRWQMNARFLKLMDPGNAEFAALSPGRPKLRERLLRPEDISGDESEKSNMLDFAGPESSHGEIDSQKPVALIPMTPWPGRAWPDANWQTLLHRLQDEGINVRVFCGPGQEKAVQAVMGDGGNVSVCHSLVEWARALVSCRAVVTIDSGPMHLADALDVPLVALFNFGRLPLWAPSAPHSVVLHRLDDADYEPAHQTDGEIARGRRLMARHTVDDVYQALSQFLQKR